MNLREELLSEYQDHPEAELCDLIKFLYQREFAGGHLISDEQASEKRLEEESKGELLGESGASSLGNGLFRLHLRDRKISLETMSKIFVATSKAVTGNVDRFKESLMLLVDLCEDKVLPFAQARQEIETYLEAGCPVCSHSETYRKAYHPAYRIIGQPYVDLLPVLEAIDQIKAQKGNVRICLEGGSASGKSTWAERIAALYDSAVYHMDDYFLQPHQKTAARLAEVGGNLDRERFEKEILIGLSLEKSFVHRPYSCRLGKLGEERTAFPKPVEIIEGAYSLHPDFGRYYDIAVFLEQNPKDQLNKIIKRNGEECAKRFVEEWIPKETAYFETFHIRERCDFVLSPKEDVFLFHR